MGEKTTQNINPDEMGFLEHLEELRWRIIKALIAIVLFSVIAFLFSDFFVAALMFPSKNIENMVVQVLKVQEMLMLKFKIAFIMGIIAAIPVVAYQFWAFVAPGLYPREKKWGPALVIFVTLFFLIGAAFAYFVLIPFALEFLVAIGADEIKRQFSLDYYSKFIIQLVLATGIVFQMPILSFLLAKMGLITKKFLRKYWRFAVVISFILAAFITPPDPVSMLMMGFPLILLYEISIYIAGVAQPKEEPEPECKEKTKET
ncbi:MAG: twin-arginine translocase subunit TatC [Candidatus Marinimicrobia bacterium]|nr:twin-arginine translocase subunit TatC [Candidatus Neomarinimicrobiota bacterium]